MSRKLILITMPDRTTWAVDADFVAKHYAEYQTDMYAENHIMDSIPHGWELHLKQEYDEVIGNDIALVSYLRENLSWSQVKDHAEKIAEAPKMTDDDYDDGLIFGAMSTVELEE